MNVLATHQPFQLPGSPVSHESWQELLRLSSRDPLQSLLQETEEDKEFSEAWQNYFPGFRTSFLLDFLT